MLTHIKEFKNMKQGIQLLFLEGCIHRLCMRIGEIPWPITIREGSMKEIFKP